MTVPKAPDMRIAVLGSGAAGMAAARRLAMIGHRPLVVAPAGTVAGRGETLSQRAIPFLRQLGWDALLNASVALQSQGRFSIWGGPALRTAGDETHGLHLDRPRLEAVMRESLSASLEHREISVTALEHLPAGVRLHLSDGTQRDADAVLDCTGRVALSCGPAAERQRLDMLVAAFQVFPLPDDVEITVATLVEAVETGWWYLSPLPDNRMMVGLFSDSDLLPAGVTRDGALWAALARNTLAIAPHLESLGLLEAMVRTPPRIAPASTSLAMHLVEGRIVRAGDAAASLDPLGANGIATALWSGIRAADAALALTQGDPAPAQTYERIFLEGIYHHLSTQRALYANEPRFKEALFWTRRRRES